LWRRSLTTGECASLFHRVCCLLLFTPCLRPRFAPLLTNEVVQSVVLVASILLAVLMAYLSSYNPRGLELKNIVPDDSYIADFLVSSSEYYPEANNLVAIVIRDTDYSDRDDVDTLEDYIR